MKRVRILAPLLLLALVLPAAAAFRVSTDADAYLLDDTATLEFAEANHTVLFEVEHPNGSSILYGAAEPMNGTASYGFRIWSEPGEYAVWATSGEESADSTFEVVAPDWTIGDLGTYGPAVEGKTVTIFALVRNVGTSGGLARVSFYQGSVTSNRLISFSNVSLDPGENHTVTGAWVPGKAGNVTLIATVESIAPPEWATYDNHLERSVIVHEAGEGRQEGGVVIIIIVVVIVIILCGSLAASFAVESTRFWLMTFLFMPMYARIMKDGVLDNRLRFLIYGYIAANSGDTYTNIKRNLGANNGALLYHLDVLEKSGKIVSLRDGKYRRFFLRGKGIDVSPAPTLTATQIEIVDLLDVNPGMTQKHLSKRTGKAISTINYHLQALERREIVTVVNDNRKTKRYVLTPEMPSHTCPHCGIDFISKQANVCPNCAHPIARLGMEDMYDDDLKDLDVKGPQGRDDIPPWRR